MHVCTYASAYPHETSYRKILCGFGKYNRMYGYPKRINRISAISATAWPALMLKLEWQWEHFLEEYPRREVELTIKSSTIAPTSQKSCQCLVSGNEAFFWFSTSYYNLLQLVDKNAHFWQLGGVAVENCTTIFKLILGKSCL